MRRCHQSPSPSSPPSRPLPCCSRSPPAARDRLRRRTRWRTRLVDRCVGRPRSPAASPPTPSPPRARRSTRRRSSDRLQTAMEGVTTVQLAMTMDAIGDGRCRQTARSTTPTDPPAMAMSMSMPALGDQPMDMRLVDGDCLHEHGCARPRASSGSSTPSDKSGPLGGHERHHSTRWTRTKSLDTYADGFQKVVFVGEEEVDGETLAHYARHHRHPASSGRGRGRRRPT